MKPSFVSPILKKVAKRAGAKILLEPYYHYAGQIAFPNGKNYYFRGTVLDLNPSGATEIAKDKAYADFFMKKLGYRTITGNAFFTREWCSIIKSDKGPEAAYCYARKLGFPVIVKPNNLSQGSGVCKVYNRKDFFAAIASFSPSVRVFLVQRFIQGDDYRIVVLGNEVISAYRRLPLTVTGDGHSSIKELLLQKQRYFEKTGRDTVIKIADRRIAANLARQGMSLKSKLRAGQDIILLDNANLSTGGDAIDVTPIIHPSYKKLAVTLTHDMGLRFCGVDILAKGDIASPCKDYRVIEINAAPGLDHYADIGTRQKKVVEDMYLKLLLELKKGATAPS